MEKDADVHSFILRFLKEVSGTPEKQFRLDDLTDDVRAWAKEKGISFARTYIDRQFRQLKQDGAIDYKIVGKSLYKLKRVEDIVIEKEPLLPAGYNKSVFDLF